jgi:plastocyanin
LRRPALTLALCLLLVAACGDDDDSGRTVTTPANERLPVVADEYSFDPSTIKMRGAGTLNVRLQNRGSLAHNLKLFRGDEEVDGTSTLPAGRSESVRLNLEHGNYRMVCTVGDHEQLGMKGTVEVR